MVPLRMCLRCGIRPISGNGLYCDIDTPEPEPITSYEDSPSHLPYWDRGIGEADSSSNDQSGNDRDEEITGDNRHW